MSDNHHLGLLVLDQSGDVVQTEFKHFGLGLVFGGLLIDLVLGFFQESGLFLLFGLGSVFLQEFEEGFGLVTVHGGRELVQSWRHLLLFFVFIKLL